LLDVTIYTTCATLALVALATLATDHVTVKKHGGIWFLKAGRIGASFYIKRAR
jgi:hypothetical protein